MSKTAAHEILVLDFRESAYPRSSGGYSKYTKRWERPSAGDTPYDPSRVFIDFKGENILDNLNNRTARPYTTLRPIVIQALKDKGIEFEKIRWSQKAGCRMCPCSPGFIIEGHYGKDFWLEVADFSDYPDRGVNIIL